MLRAFKKNYVMEPGRARRAPGEQVRARGEPTRSAAFDSNPQKLVLPTVPSNVLPKPAAWNFQSLRPCGPHCKWIKVAGRGVVRAQ